MPDVSMMRNVYNHLGLYGIASACQIREPPDALLQINTTGSDSLPGDLQGWVPAGALEEVLL